MADLQLNALGLGQVLTQLNQGGAGAVLQPQLGLPAGQKPAMFMQQPAAGTLGDRIAAYQSALQNSNLAPKVAPAPGPALGSFANGARLQNAPLIGNDLNNLLLLRQGLGGDLGQQLNTYGNTAGLNGVRPATPQVQQVRISVIYSR